MLIKEKKEKYNYSEKYKLDLIKALKKEYNLTEVLDYGSCIILKNFDRTIRAVIYIGGYEIEYKVFKEKPYTYFTGGY